MRQYNFQIKISEAPDEDGLYRWSVFSGYSFVDKGRESSVRDAKEVAAEAALLQMETAE